MFSENYLFTFRWFDRHRIISKKKTGYISGIQRTKDGDVQWDKELPRTCNLSRCAIRDDVDDNVDGSLCLA